MDFSALWDAGGAGIVLGGTLLATLLASGRRELGAAVRAMAALFTRRFDYEQARAEIARDVERMRHDGVLRARAPHTSDSEIALVTDALIHDRSLRSLIAAHEACQAERARTREMALSPLHHAAEMAPVFGMVGTLIGLIQMLQNLSDPTAIGPAMAVAMITTFYGALLANLVFYHNLLFLFSKILMLEFDN